MDQTLETTEIAPPEATEPPRKRYSGSFRALCRPEIAERTLHGAPSKLDDATAQTIARAVENGVAFGAACIAAGITTKSASRWIERGNEEKEQGKRSPYVYFVELLTRAQAVGQANLANKLATSDDWRAAAFILERRHADWRKHETAANVTNVVISDALVTQLVDSMRVAGAPALELQPAIDAQAIAIPTDTIAKPVKPKPKPKQQLPK